MKIDDQRNQRHEIDFDDLAIGDVFYWLSMPEGVNLKSAVNAYTALACEDRYCVEVTVPRHERTPVVRLSATLTIHGEETGRGE